MTFLHIIFVASCFLGSKKKPPVHHSVCDMEHSEKPDVLKKETDEISNIDVDIPKKTLGTSDLELISDMLVYAEIQHNTSQKIILYRTVYEMIKNTTNLEEDKKLQEVMIAFRNLASKEFPLVSTAHHKNITVVDWNDQDQLITGSADASLKVWDIKTGKMLHSLHGHSKQISTIRTFEKFLFSGSFDGLVKMWNMATGELLHTFSEHQSEITSITLTDDGTYLAIGDQLGHISLWNVSTKEKLYSVLAHDDAITNLYFDSDSSQLMSSSDDATITFWKDGTKVHSFSDHSSGIFAMIQHDNLLVSGDYDGNIYIYDNKKLIHTISTGEDSITNLLSLEPNLFASGNAAGKVDLWNNQGERVDSFFGHLDYIIDMESFQSKPYIVSGDKERFLQIWEFSSGKTIHQLKGHKDYILDVTVTKSDDVITAGKDNQGIIWDTKTGSPNIK